YVAFHEATLAVAERFADLFHDAHIDVVQRYYEPRLAKQQRARYHALARKRRPARFVDVNVREGKETAEAVLSAPELPALRVTMRRVREFWWIERIWQEREGRVEEKDLGVPPLLPVPDAGELDDPDVRTPEALLRSLREEMARLGALRRRGQNALYRHYFDAIRAFYGEEVARRSKEAQSRPEAAPELTYEFAPAKPLSDDAARVEVVAAEAVPDEKGVKSPVGHAAFDLKRDRDGRWRISAEYARPSPEKPLLRVEGDVCRFFLGG
ncbi:MAG: hypothetical protein ACREID_04025, partial [Planctomycetota bacterium]